MGALLEHEIVDCLTDNFKSAADSCDYLARSPKKGPRYAQLRRELKLIEGAARQMAHWREDARWLRVGLYMEEVHKRCGDWLRGVKQPDGSRRPIAPGQLHPLFVKCAEELRACLKMAETLRTKATGRVGAILPKLQQPDLRVGAPVGWRQSKGGVIMPGGSA